MCETKTIAGNLKAEIVHEPFYILPTGMTGALVSQVAIRIAAYYEYSTSTQIYEQFVTEIEFPSVTICNFNR